MSIYDKIPDPSTINLTPEKEVNRPFEYLLLLKTKIKSTQITLFSLGTARNTLKPSITTGPIPTFEIPEAKCQLLYSQHTSQTFPFSDGPNQTSRIGVLCPYEIPEVNLPCCLYFEFENEKEALQNVEICKLAANEFWHTLQFSELKRRTRCVTEINRCQTFFPKEKETIFQVCKVLQDYFGAPGVTISLIRSKEPEKIIFDKYFVHLQLPNHEQFTATQGLSYYCTSKNRPFVVYEVKETSAKLIEYDYDKIRVGVGMESEINYIRTRKTVDNEKSLMFVPLRASVSNEVIGVLKVGDFETHERFDEFNLKAFVSLSESVALLLNMLRISTTARNVGLSITNQKEFADTLEAIMSYKEISLGLFHQVSNYINEIDNKRQEIEILVPNAFNSFPELKSFSAAIKQAIGESKRLIARAQRRGGKTAPQLRKCKLIQDSLLDALKTVEHSIQKSKINLEKSLGSQDFEILVDPDFLSEAFINVLNNSVWAVTKHRHQSNKLISVFVRAEENKVVIRVEDNGEGLELNAMDKAFDPTYTTKGDSGTGLGLAFTKKVIEDCGGTVKFVRSFPGKGALLVISLPYERSVLRTI